MSDKQDFQPTPAGWAQRWTTEFAAAKKAVSDWHVQAQKIDKRFRDERDSSNSDETRWNLFTSNVQTQRALLYGKPPSVNVGRRFADAGDDVARVAGEMLERMLNTDIERDSDTYSLALQYALDDRLLSGMGSVRLRYVADFETVPAQPAQVHPVTGQPVPGTEVPEHQAKTREDVETDYVHWKDQLWSPCKVFHEVTWWAFLNQMTREKLIERFGEEIGKVVPLNARRVGQTDEEKKDDPWGRADVWEIWDKDTRQVFWFVEGYPQTLDIKKDPLELEGFWPFPRPMFANLTTSRLLPRPEYVLAQDLYNEIDKLSTRIKLLQEAVRAAGVYDKSSPELQQLMSGTGNNLYGVDNWAMFAEKGGIRGVIDWLPLEQIVGAIAVLRETRSETVDALYQITGMSDIMRGQAGQSGVTATEQGIKAKFGSIRIQALQDEFARFASDAQRIKAEIIGRLFDEKTITERANSQFGFDAQLVPEAVKLIKSQLACYRIEVKPESVSMTDFAQLKQERTEIIMAISQYITAVAPVAQQMPTAAPALMQILQWLVSGLRGASQIEGVLDQAVQSAQQAATQPQQAPPPDPKLVAAQFKAQADMQKTQADLQADLVRINAEVSADEQRERNQATWNIREATQKQVISNALKPKGQGPTGGGM